jgi:hypothetical protein
MVFLPITRAQTVSARRQKLVCPTCDCGAHQQLVDPLDARVGSLHPRDERSSHLEFGWSRPHGANRRCHIPRLCKVQATYSWRKGAIPRADFTVLHTTNNQVNPGPPKL